MHWRQALQYSDFGSWSNPLNFYTSPTYFQVLTYIHIWPCPICAVSHKPTICITAQTETGTSRASAERPYVHTHGHPPNPWEFGGCWWRQKAPGVCILPLDSRKQCFPFHTTLRHQTACARREDMQTCFHLSKDEDPHMEKFYARSPNTLYFDVIVFQSRNRGRGGGGAFLRKAFKGYSSACQPLGKRAVSSMQPLSPRRPSWGRGKGWGERGGEKGREEKLLDRSIFNDPQGGGTAARDDVRYPGGGSLPLPLPPAGRGCAGTRPLGCSVRKPPSPPALS